mgnify:FL=1
MNSTIYLSLLILLASLCLVSNAETMEPEGYQELTREEIMELRSTNFFKRIIQESWEYFDKETASNEELGRLISIKEKISGMISNYELIFLSPKGVVNIWVEAIEDENIINFKNL